MFDACQLLLLPVRRKRPAVGVAARPRDHVLAQSASEKSAPAPLVWKTISWSTCAFEVGLGGAVAAHAVQLDTVERDDDCLPPTPATDLRARLRHGTRAAHVRGRPS